MGLKALGMIPLTFTMLRKMGILRRVVNRFHKAYDALYGIGLLYRKNLRHIVNLRCVQSSRKVTIGWQDNPLVSLSETHSWSWMVWVYVDRMNDPTNHPSEIKHKFYLNESIFNTVETSNVSSSVGCNVPKIKCYCIVNVRTTSGEWVSDQLICTVID